MSVRSKVLCIILNDFGLPLKLIKLIKMCLMKPVVKSYYVNACLMHFLFRMVQKKKILYRYCFSILL
jgi:hypothetical protein